MDKRIRKRGIKASREKLEIAMLDAGIKTQASLANKIAEAENLSSPPKDTINRVFREEFVSPTTITRVAKVLSVEPHALYLSQEQEGKTETTYPDQNNYRTKHLLGKISLAIISITPEMSAFSNSITKLLKGHIKSTVLTPSLLPDQYMSVDIVRKYQSDGVISIRSKTIARYQAIHVFLFLDGVEQLIWTTSITNIELNQQPDKVAERFIPFIAPFIGLSSNTDNKISFTTIEAQDKFLQARILLDDHHSDASLKRAQSLLLSALKSCPKFALAQAALAESYICESWRSDTKELLEDAQQACTKALEITPNNSYITATLSHLYRVTGRIPESINLCKKILQTQPDNIDAISALAAAYIEAYNQDVPEITDAENQALYFAEKAVEIEADYWKHHFELGNNRFLTNRPLKALPAYEASANLNPNEIVYINLGVINLCQNQLFNARKFFKKAHELDPASYMGNEYLGSIFHFTGEYKKSIEYRIRAIDSFVDKDNITIHQIWGDLADSYRLAGNQKKAVEAYSTAIQIIERDKIQGYSNQSFKLYHYYYFYFMSYFQPDRYPSDYLKQIAQNLSDLINFELNSGAYAKLAYLLYLQGNYSESKKALEKATQICPVFFHHPDLKPIIQQLGFSPQSEVG